MTEDIIFGKNTIIEAINNYKERINKILISKNINSEAKIKEILDLA